LWMAGADVGLKKLRIILPLAFIVLFLLLAPFLVFSAGAPRVANSSSAQLSADQTASGNQVVINTTIIPVFTLLDLGGLSPVSVLVSLGQLPSNSPATLTITTSFKPLSITGQAVLANSTGSPITLEPSSLGTVAANSRTFSISIPANATSATIAFQGGQAGESILGRYAMVLPFVFVQGPVAFAYSSNVLAPKNTIISQTYGGYSASEIQGSTLEPNPAPSSVGAPSGERLYVIPSYVTTLVFQPSWFEAASIVLIAFGAVLIALSTIGLVERGRALRNNLLSRMLQPIKKIRQPLAGMARLPKSPGTRWIKAILLDPKKLLVLFLACGMIMITLAALSGPDPTYKAYVIATPTEQAQIQSQLTSIVGGNVQIITPTEDYNDFQVMSSVGTFNMVVVSQYSSLQLQDVGGAVLPYLGNVPIIVVDNSSDPTFAAQIKALYSGQSINVGRITNLNSTEVASVSQAVALNQRHNILGLVVSSSGFKEITVAEGGLSFLLFFLGALFLGAKIAEPDSDKTLFRLGAIAMYGIFVFYFTEVVYVVTSSTLTFPLSLHAVVSGATSITAVALFGQVVHLPLGGGTTPRLLSGAIGFFIGAYAGGSNRLFNKYSLALLVGVFLILELNPFSLGAFFYEGILLFVGGISSGLAASSALTFKGFLYGFGGGLGGSASQTFLLSAGKILYFAALIPLAFIKKMGKTTASIALLLISVFIGDGGVRTGEMTPDKTVIAVFPGLIAGVAFTAIFLLISAIERYISSNYTRSRP
ncbi:MAG: hypothetical protein ACREBS_06385, partial [Nitrososphaerales archaeon]